MDEFYEVILDILVTITGVVTFFVLLGIFSLFVVGLWSALLQSWQVSLGSFLVLSTIITLTKVINFIKETVRN